MRAGQALFAALFLLGSPAVAVAGPIEFSLLPTSLWTPPGSHGISTGLVPIIPLNLSYTFDPATGTPTAVEVVAFDWSLVPPPPSNPSDIAHWNNAGPFHVTLHLTDAASGESADFEMKGHIHMFNNQGPGKDKWQGDIEFRFLDETKLTLGDHTYSIWGINDRDAGPATVHITVEPNSPAHAPEPATLALGLLGLLPFALRRAFRA
jgi:hypothetical protein